MGQNHRTRFATICDIGLQSAYQCQNGLKQYLCNGELEENAPYDFCRLIFTIARNHCECCILTLTFIFKVKHLRALHLHTKCAKTANVPGRFASTHTTPAMELLLLTMRKLTSSSLFVEPFSGAYGPMTAPAYFVQSITIRMRIKCHAVFIKFRLLVFIPMYAHAYVLA